MSTEPSCAGPSLTGAAGVDALHARLLYAGLDLSSAGAPGTPLVVVELDDLAASGSVTITRAASLLHESLPLTVGVLRRPLAPGLEPLLDALTVTLTAAPSQRTPREVVSVPDVDAALQKVTDAVTHAPRAALVCGQLLRRTGGAGTTSALAAEAAAYSMLLGGNEFARWLTERGTARPAPAPSGDLVRVRREGARLSIVLDHSARRNSLGARVREELLDALLVAESDPGIESVELRGAGPAFSSGGDLAEFGVAIDPVAAYLVRLDRAPWRVLDRIADRLTVRVHGACIGAGAEIAAFAGHVVAAPDTWFRFPEVAMGLIPGAGGTVSVPCRIGRWRAAWLMLTGTPLCAREALQWGLVDDISGAPG
ncbi:enoyl-CoA hydratase/isomerase family protein [Nocardia sp. NBC_01388]|uniref:enoyl-CoA hydratase/isomerase family protein n=1 Tax=Nocardia sp. NBC_01388 TaxID=2903596 RepID=UPI00324A2EC6